MQHPLSVQPLTHLERGRDNINIQETIAMSQHPEDYSGLSVAEVAAGSTYSESANTNLSGQQSPIFRYFSPDYLTLQAASSNRLQVSSLQHQALTPSF